MWFNWIFCWYFVGIFGILLLFIFNSAREGGGFLDHFEVVGILLAFLWPPYSQCKVDENPVQIRRNLRQLRTTLTMWVMVRSSHAGGLLLKSNCCFRSGPKWHYSSETVHFCFVRTLLEYSKTKSQMQVLTRVCIDQLSGRSPCNHWCAYISRTSHMKRSLDSWWLSSHVAGISEIECIICGARLWERSKHSNDFKCPL